MNDKKTKYQDQLDALMDNEIIDLFSASSEEVDEIAAELFDDPKAMASSTKVLIEDAIKAGGRIRYAEVKEAAKETESMGNVLDWPIDKKVELIKQVSPELTKAARNRTEVDEEEVNYDIEDLIEIGIIDSDGNPL